MIEKLSISMLTSSLVLLWVKKDISVRDHMRVYRNCRKVSKIVYKCIRSYKSV